MVQDSIFIRASIIHGIIPQDSCFHLFPSVPNTQSQEVSKVAVISPMTVECPFSISDSLSMLFSNSYGILCHTNVEMD